MKGICACWTAPAVLWMMLEFSVMKINGIKVFLNCYIQKRFSIKFISALWKWHQRHYLFYFSYYVITAKWLFLQSRIAAFIVRTQLIFLLLYMRLRRNLFWINPSLTGMNPVPAMWLPKTITKRCLFEYGFPIRLRANAIFYSGNTM